MSTEALHIVCAHCGTTNRVPAERRADNPACGRCGQPVLPDHPVEVDDERFAAVLAGTQVPVVVDFWAPWCGPCRMMAPQFEAAAARLQGRALLLKVNSDDNQRSAGRFGIRGIPTLIRLEGGQEVKRVSGALPATQIVAFGS